MKNQFKFLFFFLKKFPYFALTLAAGRLFSAASSVSVSVANSANVSVAGF